MGDYLAFNDCTFPSLVPVEKYIEGFPKDIIAKTVDYITSLQIQGIDVETVEYVLSPASYGLNTEFDTSMEYTDSQGKIVNPELLDDATGVRRFECDMTDHAKILMSQFMAARVSDTFRISLNISRHALTIEEHNGRCAALRLVNIDPAEDNPLVLSGELADLILENYGSLEPGWTALILSSETGVHADHQTASMRIIGEALRETDPDAIRAWLNRTPDVFISRINDRHLMIHGVADDVISEISAGPFLAMVRD